MTPDPGSFPWRRVATARTAQGADRESAARESAVRESAMRLVGGHLTFDSLP